MAKKILFKFGRPVLKDGVIQFAEEGQADDCECCEVRCADGITIAYDEGACLSVCFSALGFMCNEDDCTWAWDFGDGSGATGPIVGHVYDEAGTYEVCLTLECNDGSSRQYCIEIDVGPGCNCCGLETNCPEPPYWIVGFNHNFSAGCDSCSVIEKSLYLAANGACSWTSRREYGLCFCTGPGGTVERPLVLQGTLQYATVDDQCILRLTLTVFIDDDDDCPGLVDSYGIYESGPITECVDGQLTLTLVDYNTDGTCFGRFLGSAYVFPVASNLPNFNFCDPVIPDPPTAPDCDGLDDCESDTVAEVTFFNATNWTAPFASGLVFTGNSGTGFWLPENLLGIDFEIPDTGGPYAYSIELYDPPGDFSEASTSGIKIYYEEYDDETNNPRTEVYIYKIDIGFACADGRVTVEYLTLHYDVFIGLDGSFTWPHPNGQFSASFAGVLIDGHILTGVAANCRSGIAIPRISFDGDLFFPAEGDDHLILLTAQVDLA